MADVPARTLGQAPPAAAARPAAAKGFWHGAGIVPGASIRHEEYTMKSRGIVNATRRLVGARKLGSATLLGKAEEEARHALTQARAWIERANPRDEEAQQNFRTIVEAAGDLERVLLEGGIRA
ncbi:hypothetical protein [Azotobacter salinestris]|uniref:hypothetical protein n=1 Tax=Azotobacter salinestris TaxID=69964 RepID=UPI001FCAB31F|nr:hypothetical protein [Azotobacter salinestris]